MDFLPHGGPDAFIVADSFQSNRITTEEEARGRRDLQVSCPPFAHSLTIEAQLGFASCERPAPSNLRLKSTASREMSRGPSSATTNEAIK